MIVREATDGDRDAVWRILEPVIRAGETYPYPRDWTREEVLAAWFSADKTVFVAEKDGALLGTYYLRPNQPGQGAHVANCGYAVAAEAVGQGVATAMCEHSLAEARSRGFRLMQFNLVVATNTRAVALWQRMEFAIIGTLPGAFAHPRLGDVDAHVMARKL